MHRGKILLFVGFLRFFFIKPAVVEQPLFVGKTALVHFGKRLAEIVHTGVNHIKIVEHLCFREKRYHRVYARHYASNPASGRVMQKLGMTREGVQNEQILKDGRYEDAAVRQKTTVF